MRIGTALTARRHEGNAPAAHRGKTSGQTFIAFVAPTAGGYLFTASFNIQDRFPAGVGINLVETNSGGLPLIFTPLGTIDGANPTFNFSRYARALRSPDRLLIRASSCRTPFAYERHRGAKLCTRLFVSRILRDVAPLRSRR